MAEHPDLRALYPDLPDTHDPAFIEECRRQSRLIGDNAAVEKDEMNFIEHASEGAWE